MGGRLLVALGVIAVTSLLLRQQPVMPVFTGLMGFVLVYGGALVLALQKWPNRLTLVFITGFILDNVVIFAAWWYFLAVNSGALETNDMYLALVPMLIVGIVRLGWLVGGIYSAVWISWLVWSSWFFYGDGSYDVRQLPVRVTFIGISVVLAMRLVAITSRERKLERVRIEELERLERFKSSVVQSISHELRTPLTTIKVCAELLSSRLAREGRTEYHRVTQSLNRATTRLERMIEQSTDFANARDSSSPLRVRPVAIEPLARATASLFSPELDAKRQSIEFVFPPAFPEIEADPVAIERVVSILLENAIKYSPAGSQIGVRATDSADAVSVAVVDNGPGIPAEDQPHVFSGLYRGSYADRIATPGTGLGLALAKQLIDRHGGQIGLTSSVGSGTTVYFTLPRTRSSEAAAAG